MKSFTGQPTLSPIYDKLTDLTGANKMFETGWAEKKRGQLLVVVASEGYHSKILRYTSYDMTLI